MREVVVVDAVRTPIGRFMGGLSSLSASDIGAKVMQPCFKGLAFLPLK